MNRSPINRTRALLNQLKQGYDWCHKNKRNYERRYKLYEQRTLPIVRELEQLGISRACSASLFFFGVEATKD